jgi:hypothetical protein
MKFDSGMYESVAGSTVAFESVGFLLIEVPWEQAVAACRGGGRSSGADHPKRRVLAACPTGSLRRRVARLRGPPVVVF